MRRARKAIRRWPIFMRAGQHEALVVDKWLAVQAGSRRADTLARVGALTAHPAFDLKNPNKVYALLRTFGGNHRHFHAADGSGYRFLAAQITALDPVNPQVAARLARCFDRWQKFDAQRKDHAKAALLALHTRTGLSRDTFEVVGPGFGLSGVDQGRRGSSMTPLRRMKLPKGCVSPVINTA